MIPPKNQKQVLALIILVNYYKDMWDKRSHLLPPSTALTSNKVKFKWTEIEHKGFDEIKRIVACDTLLIHTDFNRPFDIHTCATNLQLGEVIIK